MPSSRTAPLTALAILSLIPVLIEGCSGASPGGPGGSETGGAGEETGGAGGKATGGAGGAGTGGAKATGGSGGQATGGAGGGPATGGAGGAGTGGAPAPGGAGGATGGAGGGAGDRRRGWGHRRGGWGRGGRRRRAAQVQLLRDQLRGSAEALGQPEGFRRRPEVRSAERPGRRGQDLRRAGRKLDARRGRQ